MTGFSCRLTCGDGAGTLGETLISGIEGGGSDSCLCVSAGKFMVGTTGAVVDFDSGRGAGGAWLEGRDAALV